jgi:hypothetical protein
LEVFGGEGKGGEGIFLIISVWFNFQKGRGGKRRGAKSLQEPLFASPQIGGIWRGGEGREYVYIFIALPKLSSVFYENSKIILGCLYPLRLCFSTHTVDVAIKAPFFFLSCIQPLPLLSPSSPIVYTLLLCQFLWYQLLFFVPIIFLKIIR